MTGATSSLGDIALTVNQPGPPSPITPTDSAAFEVFSKSVQATFGKDVVTAPSSMTGNTDTRHYVSRFCEHNQARRVDPYLFRSTCKSRRLLDNQAATPVLPLTEHSLLAEPRTSIVGVLPKLALDLMLIPWTRRLVGRTGRPKPCIELTVAVSSEIETHVDAIRFYTGRYRFRS